MKKTRLQLLNILVFGYPTEIPNPIIRYSDKSKKEKDCFSCAWLEDPKKRLTNNQHYNEFKLCIAVVYFTV